MPLTIRPALKTHYSALFGFINDAHYMHRHLDWRDPLEWLGHPAFFLLEEDENITGALSCTPEPPEVAWVRLFTASSRTLPDRTWRILFDICLEDLRQLSTKPTIVSLALKEWYEELLKRNGFSYHQDIVVFLYDEEPPSPPRLAPMYRVREMKPGDIEGVLKVDNTAFEPIWRLSRDDMRFAAKKSLYCSVVECEDKIVAYQMSSSTGTYAHLARLAVLPELQGQRIGFALVQNLLDYFINQLNYWGVTLNTQHNNSASLALYQKIGFHETGERFPVYTYPYP